MKNKKILYSIITILILFIICFLLEIFVFNFNLLNINKKDRYIDLTDKIETSVGKKDNQIIKINLKKQYINKLIINYGTLEDVDYSIVAIEDDYYGNSNKVKYYDRFDEEANRSIININNNTKKLIISYDKSDIKIKKVYINNNININIYRIFFIFTSLLLIVYIYKNYKDGFKIKKLHKYFFVFGLIVGIQMIVLEPAKTFLSWDDQIHFTNVKEIPGGNVKWSIAEDNMVKPDAIGRASMFSYEKQKDENKFLNNSTGFSRQDYRTRFILYNRIAYIPSAIGYYLGKILRLPFVWCFKIGKLFNLLVYLLIISYTILISKVGKKLLTVLGLIPLSIFLATQYSYDPAVTSGIMLGSVMLINMFVDNKYKITFKNLLIFMAAMLYGSLTKAVYVPLLLLFVFVPTNRFKDKKQALFIKGGIVLITLTVMSTFVLPTVQNDLLGDPRGGNTSVSEQIKMIIGHPIGYCNVLYDSMIKPFVYNHLGKGIMIGFSYMDKPSIIPNNLYYIYFFVLTCVFFTEKEIYELDKKNKILNIIAVIGIELLIWTALYLSFTPVGNTSINGVQSRYFIPLLFIFLYSLKGIKISHSVSDNKYIGVMFSLLAIVYIGLIYQVFLVPYCM